MKKVKRRKRMTPSERRQLAQLAIDLVSNPTTRAKLQKLVVKGREEELIGWTATISGYSALVRLTNNWLQTYQ